MEHLEKILIVDDSPINIDFLLEMLHEYDVRTALSVYEAQTFIRQDAPDLILLDVNMPEKDGYTYCKELKADKRYRSIPVIFISARNEGEDIVRGFNVGGSDYITKPFQSEVVLARVKTQLRLRKMEQRYQEMLKRDDMTGLYKRSVFQSQAQKWVEHAKQTGAEAGVIAVGVGNLETINRQFGFRAGDDIIRDVATILQKSADQKTLLTRWGGGMFLYLKYDTDKERLRDQGLEIFHAIEQFTDPKHTALRILPEYNVAMLTDSNDLEQLICNAAKGLNVYPSDY